MGNILTIHTSKNEKDVDGKAFETVNDAVNYAIDKGLDPNVTSLLLVDEKNNKTEGLKGVYNNKIINFLASIFNGKNPKEGDVIPPNKEKE